MFGSVTASVRSLCSAHQVCLRVAGPADPTTVWARYVDTRLWPTWAPHIARVRSSSDLIAEGVVGTVIGVGGVRAHFLIVAVDEAARRWSWVVKAGVVSVSLEHGVLAVSDGSSVATLRLSGPAGVIDLYAPVAAWALRSLVSR